MQRVDQILRLAAGAARHQPDLAPAHRVVGQHDARRRAPLGQRDPRHPVAQLDRQVEREIERCSAPAANSPAAAPSTRSTPFGSGPIAVTPTGARLARPGAQRA